MPENRWEWMISVALAIIILTTLYFIFIDQSDTAIYGYLTSVILAGYAQHRILRG